MTINFTISEFNISGEPIPQDVADKLLKYHIAPMQVVRDALGFAIFPSQKSGYRSVKWELAHSRDGKSQHCFNGMGAVDWTYKRADSFSSNKLNFQLLLNNIILFTSYNRIAVYENFIHCDYASKSGKREFYHSDSESNWKFIKYV